MISEPITTIAQELLAGAEPVQAGRRLTAALEPVVAMELDYVKLLGAAKAVVDRLQGSVDEMVALANHVERRPTLPVDGATP
jgi:hypothetical protein